MDEEVEHQGESHYTANSPTTPRTSDPSPTSDNYPDIAGLYMTFSPSSSDDESGDTESLSGMTVVAGSNVEKYKKQIADFAAKALPSKRLSTTLSSSHLEFTIPPQFFLSKAPNGRFSNEEVPIPQSAAVLEHISSEKNEGLDESPKRGQELLVEGLLCHVDDASAKTGSSTCQTSTPITAPTIELSEDRSSLSVSMTQSTTSDASERSPGIKDQLVLIKHSASEALRNAGHNAFLHLSQVGSIFNDFFGVSLEAVQVYVTVFLKWFLIIIGFLFFVDLGGFLTYLVACNTPPVRAMFGLASVVPWIGARLPSHGSMCPPGNTISINIVCKAFHLDPEEFHFCIPTSQPEPVRDYPTKPDPLGPSFQQNTERLMNCANFAFETFPSWLDVLDWRHSLLDFYISLMRLKDEYSFVREAAEYVDQVHELAADLTMPLASYESYMRTFMSLHESATRRALPELEILRGAISGWSELANMFLPKFESSISILRIVGRWTPLSQSSIDWLGPRLSSGPKPLTKRGQSSVPQIIMVYIDIMQPALEAAMLETEKIRNSLDRQVSLMRYAAERLEIGRYQESNALVEQGTQSWYTQIFSSDWKNKLQLKKLESLERYAEQGLFLLKGTQVVQGSLLALKADLEKIKLEVERLEKAAQKDERHVSTHMIADLIRDMSNSVEALEQKNRLFESHMKSRFNKRYGTKEESHGGRSHDNDPDPPTKRAKGGIQN